MFFNQNRERLIERNQLWYIETRMGFEGPFETRSEAQNYLRLKNKAEVARIEFAGLDDVLV